MEISDAILLFEPGHGTREYTIGKHSPDGLLYEGEWARLVVPKIVAGLREVGFDARQTVTERTDPSLSERCWRVNSIIRDNPGKKVYFCSVHINAAASDGKWHNARGLSVWVAPGASLESKVLARTVYDTGVEFGYKGNRSVPAEHYWEARFAVLTGTKCPAILTENLFQDNMEDVEYLRTPEGREGIAHMHIAAFCKYFGVPFGLTIASKPGI